MLQQCNVVNLRVLAYCCVWNYTTVDKHARSANNIGIRIFRYTHFSAVFVHTKDIRSYTSNMATCYGNDVTSPYVCCIRPIIVVY